VTRDDFNVARSLISSFTASATFVTTRFAIAIPTSFAVFSAAVEITRSFDISQPVWFPVPFTAFHISVLVSAFRFLLPVQVSLSVFAVTVTVVVTHWSFQFPKAVPFSIASLFPFLHAFTFFFSSLLFLSISFLFFFLWETHKWWMQ
jgi:hypothetical protein